MFLVQCIIEFIHYPCPFVVWPIRYYSHIGLYRPFVCPIGISDNVSKVSLLHLHASNPFRCSTFLQLPLANVCLYPSLRREGRFLHPSSLTSLANFNSLLLFFFPASISPGLCLHCMPLKHCVRVCAMPTLETKAQ